jgi:hypothetical protein
LAILVPESFRLVSTPRQKFWQHLTSDAHNGPSLWAMADTVIIPNRPFWARALLFLCVIELAMGVLFMAAGFTQSSGLVLGLGVLITLLFLWLAAFAWPMAWLREPAIELRPEGLLDRRLARSVIPWEAVSWKILFNGRAYSVKFDVTGPARQSLNLPPLHRLTAIFSRLWRQPEFTLHTLGTGFNAHQLGEKLKQFKAPAA